MNWAPKNRNSLGLTPFDWRPMAQYVRSLGPFLNYREHEPDLVEVFSNNYRLVWKETEPFCIPEEYRNLKTTAHDELWETHPNNGVGSIYDRENSGYRDAPQYVKPRQPTEPTERAGLTKDQILGKDHFDPFIQKFYPNVVFNK